MNNKKTTLISMCRFNSIKWKWAGDNCEEYRFFNSQDNVYTRSGVNLIHTSPPTPLHLDD